MMRSTARLVHFRVRRVLRLSGLDVSFVDAMVVAMRAEDHRVLDVPQHDPVGCIRDVVRLLREAPKDVPPQTADHRKLR